MANTERHMFSGANTPTGFFSYFEYIIPIKSARHIFCLKGGPGVGKSTFMKRVAKDMMARGQSTEFIHCSSDPNSLDGVVFPELQVAFVDGTAPHIVDPKYPGAVDEIINLGAFWNVGEIAKNRESILFHTARISEQFSRAYSYLAAAGNIRNEIVKSRINQTDARQLSPIADEIISAEFNGASGDGNRMGLRKMFSTAISPEGLVGYIDSLIAGYDRVYVLHGNTGCGSESILEDILRYALRRGLYAEAYYCPMDPGNKIEHLLIPELGCAVCTSNTYHVVQPVNTKIIELESKEDDADIEKEIEIFNLLLDNALKALGKAKSMHDDLEASYVPNMDFDAVEEHRLKIVEQLVSYSHSFNSL